MKRKICAVITLAGAFLSCAKKQPDVTSPTEQDLPTIAVTLWTDRTELFMEYPALVAGEDAGFAVHLTDLATYRPLDEGTATIEFDGGGQVNRFESKAPARPGIFRVDVRLDRAGNYRAVLLVRAPRLQDRIDLGELSVFENDAAAIAGTKPAPKAEAIQFLKEQQWASDFATEVAARRRIEESLQVPAVVQVRGGGEGSAVSPIKGRLVPNITLPIPGQRVHKGDLLASVIPFTSNPQDPAGLKLELSQAETDLSQARKIRERLEVLLADRAIPARRVEEARIDEIRAQARIQAALERLAQYERSRVGTSKEDTASAFEIRVPLSGIVTAVSAVTGSSVEAGQEILHITDVDRVWVVALVPEAEDEVLHSLKRAQLQAGSRAFDIPGKRGRIERIGSIVDPESRRIPVIFEVSNQDGAFRIGQSLEARLGTGKGEDCVAIPLSALVDDGGLPVVFVQREGESFERRPVRTGASSGRYVQIIDGLQTGDRVVIGGAYLIRLAALSTQIPAHGHVH